MNQTGDKPENMLVNPYYAVVFDKSLFAKQDTTIAKEDWVLANRLFMKEVGPHEWLTDLLVTLAKAPTDDLKQISLNPRQAVIFSKRLNNEHEPIIDTNSWIAANENLIRELGNETWLWQLLKVLENGGTEAA
jgi:hypothetical protein